MGGCRDKRWLAAFGCAVAAGVLLGGCPAPEPASTDAPSCDLAWGWALLGNDPTVLFVVDRSTSMSEERAALARALPDFVRILATGDRTLDGPTEDDFVPVGGLHIGVVSADLGTAGYPQAGCAVGSVINYGALMFTHGDPTRSECLTEYPETSSLATVDAAGAFSLGAALDCVLSAVSVAMVRKGPRGLGEVATA